MTGHVVLLGDSIFDNGAYTSGEPDVASHLRQQLGPAWDVTLRAIDGSTASQMARQLTAAVPGATHLVVAVGGNDALMHADVLDAPARSTGDALRQLAARVALFDRDYRAAIGGVLRRGLPTTICTIYNGWFDEPRATLLRTGLAVFNDSILRVGFEHRLTIIELRAVCSAAADYANPIEPSGRGGAKIAAAIALAVAAPGAAEAARVIS